MSNKRFIAIQENSAGNSSVGSEWMETKSFPANAPIEEIWKWANGHNPDRPNKKGKLMLQLDESSISS
jgi:hypothetical protein